MVTEMQFKTCYLFKFFPFLSFLPFSHLAGGGLPLSVFIAEVPLALHDHFSRSVAALCRIFLHSVFLPFYFKLKEFLRIKKKGESRLFFLHVCVSIAVSQRVAPCVNILMAKLI